jgi:hypothetical protein
VFRQCRLPVRRFIGNTNPRSLGLARWPRKSDHSPHEWKAFVSPRPFIRPRGACYGPRESGFSQTRSSVEELGPGLSGAFLWHLAGLGLFVAGKACITPLAKFRLFPQIH